MTSVNHAMAQAMAIGQSDRLSLPPSKQFSLSLGTEASLRPSANRSPDDIDLSHRARCCVTARPVDVPSPADPGGGTELAASVRKVEQFLKDNPRMAESPFGRSVQTLMRGAVHLIKAAGADHAETFSPQAEKNLLEAVRKVASFLDDHPRIANSPFGTAVSGMARGIVVTITGGADNPGSALRDRVIDAAKQTQGFLDAHPGIAAMPLGQAVDKLIEGVREMGDVNTIDPDIQTLAKRISHFVANHPRLAESDFGQLVATLTRGILALETTVPPVAAPPVAGDLRPGDGVAGVRASVSAGLISTTMISIEADLQKAA